MKESISFDRIADRYDETRGGEQRGDTLAADIDPYLGDAERVLEVGVGTGIVAAGLGRLGRPVVGVDVAAEMLARAHERLGSRVARADAHALPVPTASVDGAYLVWVLHVVADPAAVIAECARVLRPGSRLVVIAGHPRTGDAGDMTEYSATLDHIRTDRPDNAEAVAAWAHAAGLERLAYKELVETHSSTPADFADVIEKRSFSWIWDLDEQTWNEVVQPVIDGLRALPEPTRGRSVTLRRDLLAFTR
ncbi:MAG: methyltransferase domain-containing protein [Acidimicrobiia bacterium]|nr:methyltransferase domain-containing protein [Acidimicrobiia bacterium]